MFAVTGKGRADLDSAATSLSPIELKLMVMMDGKATVEQIMKNAPTLPPEKVDEALKKLERSGYIVSAADVTSDLLDAGNFFSKESDSGLASLKQHGYYVKIARRAAQYRKLAEGEQLTVLVVEDDPQLAKLLRTYFQMEGMQTRVAANRDEINLALRQPPKPDVVLLDVVLPDIDGFDVLAKMREHEAVKSVPVIMMTAKATREAVLKGLQGGADGYVTKPFEVDVLLKAVKTVLGVK